LVEDTLPGLSEFLYLYKFQEKPPQAKLQANLQAIFRKISCPDYSAGFAVYITLGIPTLASRFQSKLMSKS